MRLKSGIDVRIFQHFIVQRYEYIGWSGGWLVSLLIIWFNAREWRFLASALDPTKGFHPKSEFILA